MAFTSAATSPVPASCTSELELASGSAPVAHCSCAAISCCSWYFSCCSWYFSRLAMPPPTYEAIGRGRTLGGVGKTDMHTRRTSSLIMMEVLLLVSS
eukprot:6881431-Prymnesium_polylepis.1